MSAASSPLSFSLDEDEPSEKECRFGSHPDHNRARCSICSEADNEDDFLFCGCCSGAGELCGECPVCCGEWETEAVRHDEEVCSFWQLDPALADDAGHLLGHAERAVEAAAEKLYGEPYPLEKIKRLHHKLELERAKDSPDLGVYRRIYKNACRLYYDTADHKLEKKVRMWRREQKRKIQVVPPVGQRRRTFWGVYRSRAVSDGEKDDASDDSIHSK